MPGNHNEIEKRLWDAADELRANSALREGSSLLLAFSRREREFWDRVLNLGREKGDKSHFLCSTVRKLNPGIADEVINVAVETSGGVKSAVGF